MHDISDLEARGVPGVFIASSEFVEAAEAQGVALGFAPAVHYVAHPIQDRDDEEIRLLADAAYEEILGKIAGQSHQIGKLASDQKISTTEDTESTEKIK